MDYWEFAEDLTKTYRKYLTQIEYMFNDDKTELRGFALHIANVIVLIQHDFGKAKELKQPMRWVYSRFDKLHREKQGEYTICISGLSLMIVLNKIYIRVGKYHIILYNIDRKRAMKIIREGKRYNLCIDFTNSVLYVNDEPIEFDNYRISTDEEEGNKLVPEEISDDYYKEQKNRGYLY